MNQSATVQQGGAPEQGPFYNLDGVLLPAAGAFTAQVYSTIPALSRRLSIVVSYVKGASAVSGNGVFIVQWTIQGGAPEGAIKDVYETVIDGTTVVKADPLLQNPEYAYSVAGPITTSSITFRLLSLEVPVGATAFRVLAAELGDTAHPGTVTVRGYTSNQI